MKHLSLYDFLKKVRFTDKSIIQLIFDYDGIIYGGYLRDVIAGEEPTDIDVIIYKKDYEEFVYKLERKGYRFDSYIESHNIYTYSKTFSRDIQFHFFEDGDDGFIDAYQTADCDVNCLAYDGNKLFNKRHPNASISKILSNIRNKRAIVNVEECDDRRFKKMTSKGYDLIY